MDFGARKFSENLEKSHILRSENSTRPWIMSMCDTRLIFCSSEKWSHTLSEFYNLGPHLGPQNQEFVCEIITSCWIFNRFLRYKMQSGAMGPQIGAQMHTVMRLEQFFLFKSQHTMNLIIKNLLKIWKN